MNLLQTTVQYFNDEIQTFKNHKNCHSSQKTVLKSVHLHQNIFHITFQIVLPFQICTIIELTLQLFP